MGKLDGLKPAEVFHFFEEISRIPRGSGNVEAISDYLKDFAESRGLVCVQDEVKNIIIIKEASPGYEQEEPVILQGHMDMVAVKDADCTKDMTKEGLDLRVDGDWLYAEGTSLGADDGIAVACALALLDSDSIPHPRLEVVLTVDEETGMEGANAIDLSICRGRRMLNLDYEEEGVLLTSCAGGARVHGKLAVSVERITGTRLDVYVEGLKGGHSGSEIDKGRANANVLLGRMMRSIPEEADARFLSLEGGSADNAIPSSSRADLVVKKGTASAVREALEKLAETLRREYAATDGGISIRIGEEEDGEWEAFSGKSTEKITAILYLMPNGIQRMSADIPGLVQTSLNLGILGTEGSCVSFDYSIRSSVGSEKTVIVDRVCLLLSVLGAEYTVSGEYPAWEYRKDSALRDRMVRIYEKMFGSSPKVEAIHAGLECGILSPKLPGLDCVSIGPDMQDIHTPRERLSISSTERVWNYILEILKK